ncbi:MAG: hypothetical protein M3437_04805 [Chloroflexota bacterium]|nr:hypothetical protein [Chloroflexota bacterium]MDQ5867584.1 hypothetical protein [Chloroflexota bacterium]
MKTKYKRLAPLVFMLLFVTVFFLSGMRRDLPEWGTTVMYVVLSALVVIGGTLALVPTKDD